MVATDGTPATVGRYRGFSLLLKVRVPTVHTAHCFLHKQHLVATDGTPATVGRHRGFSLLLKVRVPTVHTAHCLLHRQHLVGEDRVAKYVKLLVCASGQLIKLQLILT